MSRAVSAATSRPDSEPRAGLIDRGLEWTVLIVLALTLVLYLSAPFLAFTWWRQPFLGAFVEQTLIFNGVGDRGDPAWPARNLVPENDQLTAIDQMPVASTQDLNAALARYRAGDPVTLTTRDQAGLTRSVTLILGDFPFTDRVRFFFLPYLIGALYLAAGGWVFRIRGREPVGRSFALTCALTAIATGGLFDMYTTHVFTWAWTLAVPNAGAAAASLALVFPQPIAAVRRRPLLRLVSFIPGLALAGYALITVYWPGADPRAYVGAWRLGYYYLGATLALLIGLMFYRWRADRSPLVSAQSRIIFFGTALAFAPLLLWVVEALVLGLTPPFNVLLYLGPILLFPAAMGYALLRYRLVDTDAVVGQALVYALLGALSVAAYSLIIAGLSLIAGAAIRADDPLAVGLLVFLLVLAFNPLRARTQQMINRVFFRGSRSYTARLEQFGRTLTQAPALADITRALQEALEEVLRPAHAHVFLREAAGVEYAAAADAAGRPTSDLRYATDGPLAGYLAGARASLLLSPDQPLPERLLRDRARLAVQGSALFVPMPGKSGLTGWLAVGPKLSGEPFRPDDLRFVESLADQAALAIERATVINDLERRVKELNVVSQMSQAVSFTRAFDDLLELIHAQTSKIVDARNFYLLLKDRRGAQYAFVVEGDERLSEREGKPAPVTHGLEAEVLRTGQPIRVDDYTEECHRRGVVPGAKLYRAWLGMPLNAGRETLGMMVVAATDPTVTFTDDQAKVCATIADQAASALTRARLLQQAEQRARQLSTLNEVSLTIASTLELDPLLQRIVQSAANILNCEAGSLFLTDPETGESVFRVATGPVGQNLIGMRVAPGKGFVGEAIEGGKAVIVNDAQADPRWFRGTDQSTGFITHALITVPLRYQSRPIGAIQLINKRDGSPFDDDDQTLLTAFATPSAIAIENARLFTQTDQALAARVEELSVMQRIGRELNTTLDTALVAGITLSWAMKSLGATAGWVGVAGEAGLSVIECEGYGEGEARLLAGPLSLEQGLAGRVFRSGEPVRVAGAYAELGDPWLAEATRAALAAPIRREGQVAGLVVLESLHPEAFPEENIAFLTRLLDLTSIALTNSRLYAEVNAANIAKSEFVSFVAHELKTPMTSIKGYADLLVGGAVGPVNDMQKQFLSTIRSNVERMNTLVSDLSDVARIESGRLRLEPKPLDFGAIIEDVTRSTKALVDAKRQTLTVEAAVPLPAVRADQVRLTQVLTNLVSNAYKYTPESGQIWLRAAPAANTWDPAGAPQVLHVVVQDTGIGISAEDQKKLFQKFFRAEDRLAREMAPGTGLGLNIVKNLVELQGGRIWLESEFRKGSAFHFTVPLAAEG